MKNNVLKIQNKIINRISYDFVKKKRHETIIYKVRVPLTKKYKLKINNQNKL